MTQHDRTALNTHSDTKRAVTGSQSLLENGKSLFHCTPSSPHNTFGVPSSSSAIRSPITISVMPGTTATIPTTLRKTTCPGQAGITRLHRDSLPCQHGRYAPGVYLRLTSTPVFGGNWSSRFTRDGREGGGGKQVKFEMPRVRVQTRKSLQDRRTWRPCHGEDMKQSSAAEKDPANPSQHDAHGIRAAQHTNRARPVTVNRALTTPPYGRSRTKP